MGAEAKAKVVYDDGDKVRSILGIWEDIGWAVRVWGPNGEYMIIPKNRLIKIVRDMSTMERLRE